MEWDYEIVSASYARCLQSGGFFDSFYDTLLAKSTEIPPLFAKTDFEKQKHVVAESIPFMLAYASGKEFGHEFLAEIAERHCRRQLNIDPALYPLWLESLCETIKKHDPEWTEQLDDHWRGAMQPGIDLIVAAH